VLLSAAAVITPRRSFLTAKLFQPPVLSACTGALSKPNFLDAFHFNCSATEFSCHAGVYLPDQPQKQTGCLLSVERICAWIEINYNLLAPFPITIIAQPRSRQ
jgi:hypothetical protein